MPDRDERLTTEDIASGTRSDEGGGSHDYHDEPAPGDRDRDERGSGDRVQDGVRNLTEVRDDDERVRDDQRVTTGPAADPDSGIRERPEAWGEEREPHLDTADEQRVALGPATRGNAEVADQQATLSEGQDRAAQVQDYEGQLRGDPDEPLLSSGDLDEFRRRWEAAQTRFVDEPRRAVEDADALVAEVMRQLANSFASERSQLEEHWSRGGGVDTEMLRVTLQRYRSFFNRLLSA